MLEALPLDERRDLEAQIEISFWGRALGNAQLRELQHSEFDRLCAVNLFDTQRAQPEGADDVGSVRDVVVRVFDGGADGFEIAPGLFQQ